MAELSMMAEGRQRDNWQCVSSLLAMILNVNVKPSDRVAPREFDPFAVKKPIPKVSIKDMKASFIGKPKRDVTH